MTSNSLKASTTVRFLSPDSLVFLLAAGLGSAAIFGLKPLGVSQLVVTGSVCAMVVGYGLLLVSASRFRLRLDQAGDNCYYLGLIFTLLSMVRALWEVGAAASVSNGQGVRVAEAIIGDFGIALASTLVGIVMRLLLQQMRIDPADVEQEMRLELADAATRMRANLGTMLGDFSRFHRELTQQHGDYATQLREHYKGMADAAADQISVSAERAAENLEATARTIGESVLVFAKTAEALTAILGESTTRLKEMEAPRLKLGSAFSTFGDRIDQISARLQENEESLSTTLATIAEAGGHFKAAMHEITRATEALQASTERGAMRVERVEDALRSATMGISETTSRYQAVVGELKDSTARVSEQGLLLIADIQTQIERTGAKAEQARSEIQRHVEDVSRSASESSLAAHEAQASAQEVLHGLRAVVSEIDGQIKRTPA